MKHSYLLFTGMSSLLLMSACIDDNYRINDVNTLSRINVNDLTIPLNVDKILLDSIVDFTDGTDVGKYKDPATGKEYYALRVDGDIESDPIEINEINVGKPEVRSLDVPLSCSTAGSPVARRIVGGALSYDITEHKSTEFEYSSDGIDGSVSSITALQTVDPVNLSIRLSLPESLKISKTVIEGIEIQFPAGLTMADGSAARANVGSYDPATGTLSIPSYELPDPHRAVITVNCQGVNFDNTNSHIDADRRFVYSGRMGVYKKGRVTITPRADAGLPENFDILTDYDLDAFSVRNFSGELDYVVKNTEVEPIHLDDLPDFLRDPATKVMIADPRLYLGVYNSTAPYGARGSGTISMVSDFRNNGSYASKSPLLMIGETMNTNFVLSPSGNVANPLPEFSENLKPIRYPEMKYILSGNESMPADGLPIEIRVEFENPRFFGHAVKFPVKNSKYPAEVGRMKGDYCFFAPLSFENGSVIAYSERTDIDGDEMDNIYVKCLTVKAMGLSSFPVDVKLSVSACDEDDRVLGRSNTLELAALASSPVDLKIVPTEGETMRYIHHLQFNATIFQNEKGAGTSLAPDQGLELSDLRITVSGYYEKKF